jgi:hypothetical protein
VRFVAVDAQRVAGVFLEIDLREGGRPAVHLRVTRHTHGLRVGFGWADDIAAGVGRKRPVTGFAADLLVLAAFAFLNHRVVTLGAALAPRVRHGPRGRVFQRAGSIKTVDAEVGRHEDPPDEEEDDEAHGEQAGHTRDVFVFAEPPWHLVPPPASSESRKSKMRTK